jgi:hypothetical protein
MRTFATDYTDFHGSSLEFLLIEVNYTEAAELLIRGFYFCCLYFVLSVKIRAIRGKKSRRTVAPLLVFFTNKICNIN